MVSHADGDVGAGKLTGEVLDMITKVHLTVSQLSGAGSFSVSEHRNNRGAKSTAQFCQSF